ncbi:MAG TPA: HEAT repeat domain-containing protein [Gemmatimonadaceae bacterium]|nr:HEAT repeat domain-containing protein [Gemmatimonadaceae bacterium]
MTWTAGLIVQCAAALATTPAAAQPLGERVTAAGSGDVRVHYATRPGVCGDGRTFVAVGENASYFEAEGGHGFGRMGRGTRCAPGPSRVTFTLDAGRPTRLRVRVGGADAATARDLGEVPAAEAGAYFLSLARSAGAPVARQALLAAVVADDFDAAPGLAELLADAGRPDGVRAMAAHWLAAVAGEAAVPALDRAAADGRAPRAVREAAMASLADQGEEAGVTALVRHIDGADLGTARRAAFWLGQSERPRAHAVLRALADRPGADRALRGEAIFALGHGAMVEGDAEFLRALYARLDDDGLRERVLQSVAETDGEEGGTWLLGIARDERASLEQRKKALFWAGQGEATPTARLVEAYRAMRDPALREHAIFVLSQRDDDAALDALIEIARRDPDRSLRKKALFWLGQKDDPRAEALIRELVLGQ